MPDGNKLTFEKGRTGNFKFASDTSGTFKVSYDQIGGHKPSILQSLGIDTLSPLAERWLKVTKKFYKFVHRRGVWQMPRNREDFVPLWNEFEDVLADLVGNYLNLLSRVVDRILTYDEPTNEIRGVLPNLLKSETRRKYFFEKLDSSAWLEPLREDGWFDPESNISVRHSAVSIEEHNWSAWWKPLINAEWFDLESSSLTKVTEQRIKTFDRISPWYALEYVKRIAKRTEKYPCDTTINTLVKIVDMIVDCPEDTREKIIKDSALSWQVILIISFLPENKKKEKHCLFSTTAMKFKEDEMSRIVPVGLSGILYPEAFYSTEGWVRHTDPTDKIFSRVENTQIATFLEEFEEKENGDINPITEGELAGLLEECVTAVPQKFGDDLQPFRKVLPLYQHSVLSGFLAAWQNKKEFDWVPLLEFVYHILLSESFWTKLEVNSIEHKDQILSVIADLISAGTRDDSCTFDVHLLPLAEEILLLLVEKVESSRVVEGDPFYTFLGSSRGKVFCAIKDYALCFARTNYTEKEGCLWPQAIKEDFTKRLDKSIESSFEFSFALGMFLQELFYLDQKWVINNIDRIFSQHDEYHWYVAFSSYLLTSQEINKSLYFLLKENGHYQKALNTNFAHREVATMVDNKIT